MPDPTYRAAIFSSLDQSAHPLTRTESVKSYEQAAEELLNRIGLILDSVSTEKPTRDWIRRDLERIIKRLAELGLQEPGASSDDEAILVLSWFSPDRTRAVSLRWEESVDRKVTAFLTRLDGCAGAEMAQPSPDQVVEAICWLTEPPFSAGAGA
ncbi:MAG: hypothetical protein ABSE73_21735 [Planctomycetota bacterium]